jgi:cysteine desulfurase
MDLIYLDNSASTPLLPEVWEAMRSYGLERGGNAASSHRAGRLARQALEDAREHTAALLDAHPEEVLFTSGATEANNLAIFGLARCDAGPAHLISSPLEHPCVSEPIRQMVEAGYSHDVLPVDERGLIVPAAMANLLRPETRLVSVMLANHETGAIQPIADLMREVHERGPFFHCDAAAAAGKMAISFKQLRVTSLTVSGHKFHGPQGVGALLVRRHVKLRPLMFGGHQQQGRRPGTEPVALAVGLATALSLATRDLESRHAKVTALRERFLHTLQANAAPVVVNGPGGDAGLPHTLNVSFPGCRADVLLMNLDLAGVACSTGSACSSGSLLPSPVLQAMRVADDVLHSAMRFSFSFLLTEAEVDEAARRVVRGAAKGRELAPDVC